MPRGELRRKDRAMSQVETEALLDRALVGRIATVGPDGMPYAVPMSFVYDSANRTLYLHCALTGHLLDNLAHSPLACFEVDEAGPLLDLGDDACETSQAYSSAICFGHAGVVASEEEREKALWLFVKKYVDRKMVGKSYNPRLSASSATVVIAMSVESATGKRRPE